MGRRFLEQILAVMVAVIIIFSSTTSQVLATEVPGILSEEILDEKNENKINLEQRNSTRNLDTVATEQTKEGAAYLEKGKNTSEYIDGEIQKEGEESASLEREEENLGQIVEENISKENMDEVRQEESKEAISPAQKEDSLEQTAQENMVLGNTSDIEDQKDITKESEYNLEIEEDEIALQKTRVIRTSNYEEYYEENVKLVKQYNSSINSESPYALRRILGKMDWEINLENYGATVLVIGPDNSFILQFETEEMTEQAFLKLSQLEQLTYCELDATMTEVEPVEETDHIAEANTDWDIKMLEIDQYIKYVKEKVGNKSITVCVLDTGTDATHPKLKGKIKEGIKKAAYTDEDGHGTHVAGIVAKCTDGLNVNILPIYGIGDWSLATNGTKLAVSKGAKVINMSFGTTYYGDNLIKMNCYEAFHDAIKMALDAGASIVTAAGNNGYTDLTIEDYYECPSHFGIEDGVITVASVDENQKRAWDSGHGSAVDLAAPGVNIYSTHLYHTYKYMSGTSMATPHITAIVAMMRLVNPEKSPVEIENLLKSYCKDKGAKGRDDCYGQGIPQMSRAIADIGKLNAKHVWNEEYTIDKAPSCTETGTKSIHCVDCGMIKPGSTTTVKALGHNKTTTIVKASLTKSGSSTVKCSRCSYTSKKTIYYPKTIELARKSYQYTGKAKKPAVTVIDSKGNEIDASNYTVQYEGERIQAGTYTVKIQFKGKYYKGTASRTFTIQDKRPYQKIVTKNYEKVYGDIAFKVKASLTSGDGSLSFQSSNPNVATVSLDGKVTIKGAGEAIITITAGETSNYKKTSVKSNILVRPKANNIISLKNTNPKQMIVIWEKSSYVTGYRLVYSENSNFTNLKSFTYKTNKTGTRTVNDLKKGQKYYVKICTYVTGADGTKYYSAWSSTKSIIVAK